MSAPLRLVRELPAVPEHPLLALADGHPVLLGADDADLIALVNAGTQVLDPATDPDAATAATMQLAWFTHHVGKARATDGDRSQNLASHLRRYVLPFLVELNHAKPVAAHSIASLRFLEVEQLTQILAGAAALPAATVAGDLLGRSPLTALWLTVLDAAAVSHGGAPAVQAAVASGALQVHRDQDGHRLIASADLRNLGLLIEPDAPHGMSKNSAGNVLFPLKGALCRAQNLGANVRGDFTALQAVRPLLVHRMHDPRVDCGYVGLETLRTVAAHLHVVHQVVLWLLRVMGLRIGEAFGLLVEDLFQDEQGLWLLAIEKQGGRVATVLDPSDGQLKKQDNKPRTKTPQSHRIIRVPDGLMELLLQIITIFHTDPDGTIRTDARLIPGLRKDDAGGMSAFSSALEKAIALAQCPSFVPHDLRGHLITDLSNAGVEERVAEYYTGHRDEVAGKKTVHEQYDDGVPAALQHPAIAAVQNLLESFDGADLIVPTSAVESWGVNTRAGLRRDVIEAQMRSRGWRTDALGVEPGTALLDTVQVAERLDKSPTEVRRLFQSGKLPARKVRVGSRLEWRLDERDVAQAIPEGMTLADLAKEIGQDYFQTRAICVSLGVLRRDGSAKGTAVLLDATAVALVRAEVQRRREAAANVVDLAGAARELGLPVGQIEKLYRSAALQPAPDPMGGRRRHVTRDSVAAYAARIEAVRTHVETRFVPAPAVRKILGLTRPQLSGLVGTRRLAARSINRREHLSLSSVQDYRAQLGLPMSMDEALAAAAVQS